MLTAARAATPPSGSRHQTRPWLLVVALATLAIGIWACWSVTVDDAYITYRYSANLANGFGLTWNPGQDPVEGFTNFTWMLLHVPWVWAGIPLPWVSKLIAAGFAAGIVWLLAREPRTTAGAALAAGSFVLFLPTWVHVDAGLETAPFAFVILRAAVLASRILIRPDSHVARWEPPALLLLAGTLRPDGILGVAPALMVWLWLRRHDPGVWMWTAAAAVVGAGYMTWRWLFFGYPLPNTFYVKVGVDAALDGRWLQTTVAALLPLLALAVAAMLRPDTSRPALLVAVSCVWLWLIPALSAPAMDYMSRFAWHGFPALCLAAAWAVDGVTSRRVAAVVTVAAMTWTTAAGFLATDARTLVNYGADLRRAHVAIGLGLADSQVPDELRSLAVTDAGAIPYYSGWHSTDYIGLNDERIAHGASAEDVLMQDDPSVLIVTNSGPAVPPTARGVELDRVIGDRVLVASVEMRSAYYQLVFARPVVAVPVKAALDRRLAEGVRVTDARVDPGYGRWLDRLKP